MRSTIRQLILNSFSYLIYATVRFREARLFAYLRAQSTFWQEWLLIRQHCRGKGAQIQVARQEARKIARMEDIPAALVATFTEGNKVIFAQAEFEFVSEHALWRLMHEIFIDEEYYFNTEAEDPLVLDCGTNFGMAIYYFKSIYPNARVIGFEPVPSLREIAQRNIENASYSDVEILPYALSAVEKDATFNISKKYPMAGSLTDRRMHFGDEVISISVECRRLSDYLTEKVDFLKLDIEGSEVEVLRECKSKLSCVSQLVCEYHHGAGNTEADLVELLQILAECRFEYHIDKSDSFRSAMANQPVLHANKPYSLLIYARNRSFWSNEGESRALQK